MFLAPNYLFSIFRVAFNINQLQSLSFLKSFSVILWIMIQFKLCKKATYQSYLSVPSPSVFYSNNLSFLSFLPKTNSSLSMKGLWYLLLLAFVFAVSSLETLSYTQGVRYLNYLLLWVRAPCHLSLYLILENLLLLCVFPPNRMLGKISV